MEKDLIIGGASNYTWDHLKYWVNSIKRTGFKGDIVLVVTNMSTDTMNKLVNEGVKLYAYGTRTEDGIVNNTKNAPHVERFIHIWNYLHTNEDYRFVTVTDTRDVIFQRDPSEFLEKNTFGKSIVASSECMTYKDEPWNNQNIGETFGQFLYPTFREYTICNVGVISGFYDEVKDLLLFLFQQSINRPIPIVDQAVYNFIINQLPFKSEVLIATNEHAWAAQLGVTKYAIESGAGDIGLSVKQNPSLLDEYIKVYKDEQPLIEDAIVKNHNGEEFHIVHQWDRIPFLKEKIEKYYGDI